ncbi:Glycosyltransferase involved in cell wall bisynthesis [Halorientalis persicus]|uniref:Glycosyltransferase involved in cell wall bisynthesis n=1 Tax=Halorientalis persicus TaxID=1367881 RepID=A0A1H8WVU0_9EURY|nr:glycosyltransferase [Halorientalis persicus]SEP31794.1 Glycosyltransferase involved in cell wall bisynthesis [Halorientalis persicus]
MAGRKKVTFVQTAAPGEGGVMHPVHEKMADSVDADIQTVSRRPLGPLNGTMLSDASLKADIDTGYDVLIIEEPGALYTLPRISLTDTTVIYFHTSPEFAGASVYPFKDSPTPVRLGGKAHQSLDARVLKQFVRSYVDGIITVSDLFADRVQRWYNGLVTVATPFIEAEKQPNLEDVDVSLNSQNAVFVGFGRGHKGVDQIVDVWPRVRNAYPKAMLQIYGKGHPSKYSNVNGVTVKGYADSLSTAFNDAALFIHPARLDAHPLAPLEGMFAGVPAIVSGATGSKTALAPALSNLVVNNHTPERLSQRIQWYFGLPNHHRKKIAKKCETIARQYTEAELLESFKEALQLHLD